jgi:hypothetical protein
MLIDFEGESDEPFVIVAEGDTEGESDEQYVGEIPRSDTEGEPDEQYGDKEDSDTEGEG